MSKFIVVSGYTKNTHYEDKVRVLQKSLKKYNLDYKLYGYDCLGKWEANCQQKSKIIYEAMQEFKKPVVWLDADAVVYSNPFIFNNLDDYDFAYHFLRSPDHLASGTLYFNYNDIALRLVEEWIKLNAKEPWELDQRTLQKLVWNEFEKFSPKSGIKQYFLPVEYCKIFDNAWQGNNIYNESVIMHYQASRETKKKENAFTKPVKTYNPYINKSVLICGNGELLPEHMKKVDINKYDYVMRMNNWQPSPQVGNKCDIWLTTFWEDIPAEQIIKMRKKHIWDCYLHGGCFDYKETHKAKVKQCLNKYPEFVLDKVNFDYFRLHDIKIPSPSTGMYAVFMALKKKMKPTLVGYNFFTGKNHHYFSNKPLDLSRQTTPHPGQKEKEWVTALEKNGLLRVIR